MKELARNTPFIDLSSRFAAHIIDYVIKLYKKMIRKKTTMICMETIP